MSDLTAGKVLALPTSRRWKSVGLTLLVSTAIGILFALMEGSWAALPQEVLISDAIGGCIWLLVQALRIASRDRLGILTCLVIAVPIGLVVGGKIMTLFGGYDLLGRWVHDPVHQWRSIGASLLFASGASAFVVLYSVVTNYRLELETERRRSAEISRSQAIAELALLQAQIEPHFLFNTLAHVQSTIEQQPALGKTMLEHLIRYLRGTLRRSRASSYALAEEQELIEALLAIAALRLGTRLHYRVSIDASLRNAQLPPLLLQPLVENAIRHGIEPAMDGGEIAVDALASEAELVLTVSDTGVGVCGTAPEGVGLSNVRARLASLYGPRGRLTLRSQPSGGVIAELRLPLERT